MKVELQLERLEQIQDVIGSGVPEIVAGMLATLSEAVAEAERRVAESDLEATAKAAHAARNDALLVGAQDLLAALTVLEAAARRGETSAAETALATVREVWPGTRDELARVAARSD
jgi:hypothetical protein